MYADLTAAINELCVEIAQRRDAYRHDGSMCGFPRCRNKCVALHRFGLQTEGDSTSGDNAAWLCAFHVWLVNEGNWTLQRQEATGEYLWTNPYGKQPTRSRRPGAVN